MNRRTQQQLRDEPIGMLNTQSKTDIPPINIKSVSEMKSSRRNSPMEKRNINSTRTSHGEVHLGTLAARVQRMMDKKIGALDQAHSP